MRYGVAGVIALALTLPPAARADDAPPPGDPAAGKVAFGKCAVCHSPDAGVNRTGPSLHGIVGRHSASVSGFNYSPAMRATNWDWTPARLDAYLLDPRGVVQGTRMIFRGLSAETERANLIAYLRTLK